MFKNIFIIANLVVILFFNFFENDVSVTINIPDTVTAGDTFTVEIVINKGSINDFSRFQQEMPVGFYVTPIETAGGDFRFQDNKVKILWYKGGLPSTDEFKIVYQVKVDPTIAGTVVIDGEFSYIDEGTQGRKGPKTPIMITILPGDTEPITKYDQNIENYKNSAVPTANVACTRQRPFANENGEIIVNLMVEKSNIKGYGKILEKIPAGFTAVENTKDENVIFSFKGGEAKFLWMTLPASNKFLVSYKLIPDEGNSIDNLGASAIIGEFFYVDANNVTIPVAIMEKDVDLNDPKLIAGNVTVGTTNPQNGNNNGNNGNNGGNQGGNQGGNTNGGNQNNGENQIKVIPDPETGVSYKVQIGAYRRDLNVSYFKTQKVYEPVTKIEHNGLNKYLVGKFEVYKDARDGRVNVWNSTPIKDAFVTAYNDGERITVQEALMITKQDWVK